MVFPTLVERHVGEDQSGFDRALLDSQRYIAAAMLLPAAAGGGAAVGDHGVSGPDSQARRPRWPSSSSCPRSRR